MRVRPNRSPRGARLSSVGRDSHLARVGRETAHESVTVGAGGGALVVVLDDDSLLAGVAALEKDNHLVGLKVKRERRASGKGQREAREERGSIAAKRAAPPAPVIIFTAVRHRRSWKNPRRRARGVRAASAGAGPRAPRARGTRRRGRGREETPPRARGCAAPDPPSRAAVVARLRENPAREASRVRPRVRRRPECARRRRGAGGEPVKPRGDAGDARSPSRASSSAPRPSSAGAARPRAAACDATKKRRDAARARADRNPAGGRRLGERTCGWLEGAIVFMTRTLRNFTMFPFPCRCRAARDVKGRTRRQAERT